jgi:hypothetical protein
MAATTTIHYDMMLTATEASTGFFACIPAPDPGLDTALAWLRKRPMDTFLYRYLLDQMAACTPAQLESIWREAPPEATAIRALLVEAKLSGLMELIERDGAAPADSPLPLMRLECRQ